MDEASGKIDPACLLFADDDEILCSVRARALQRRQHKVTVAHDYRSALAVAAEHLPRVVQKNTASEHGQSIAKGV